MILDNEIEISISYRNLGYYREILSDNDIKNGDKKIIKIYNLYKNSALEVKVKCDVCGNEKLLSYKMYNKSINKYNFYACSSKCSQKKVKNTCLNKFGVENVSLSQDVIESRKITISKKEIDPYNIKKSIETNLKRYGVKNISQFDSIKEKKKITFMEKYGVSSYTKTDEYKIKSVDTCLKKFNSTNYRNSEIYKEYLRMKNIDKFSKLGIINYNTNDKILLMGCDKGHDYYIDRQVLYNRKYVYDTEICTVCNPLNIGSGYENQLQTFISDNYKGEILLNNRKIIKPYEIDIYLPELNLAIEFNGSYWHSSIYKDKYYHLNKSNECCDKNIKLYQIYEQEWIENRDYVESNILYLIGHNKNILNIEDVKLIIIYNKIILSFDNRVIYSLEFDKIDDLIFINDLYRKNHYYIKSGFIILFDKLLEIYKNYNMISMVNLSIPLNDVFNHFNFEQIYITEPGSISYKKTNIFDSGNVFLLLKN